MRMKRVHAHCPRSKFSRVAMMTGVGYAIQKYVYKQGAVNEIPFYFTPVWNFVQL
jgi:hypothetical protein